MENSKRLYFNCITYSNYSVSATLYRCSNLVLIKKQTYFKNLTNKKTIIMGNLLYTIAVILVIIWALGFFGVLGTGIATGGLIHILLVIAIIIVLLRVISGRKPL